MADYRAAARRAAERYGLDPDIFTRQIQQESGFNPTARSPAGAQGIAQIMPATARGWGVDPSDPIASLNAAAKNMARYVKDYGSYRNALIAYNAGPGRVGSSSLPTETQNYIKIILGGSDPGKLSTPKASSPAVTAAASTAATSPIASALQMLTLPERQQPTVTGPSLPEFAAKAASVVTKGPPGAQSERLTSTSALKALDQLAGQQQDSVQVTPKGAGKGTANSSGNTGSGFSGSGIRELFWQGKDGINLKNGQSEPMGFVSGHQDHVHVAAGPKTVVQLGKLAQQMGLHVGENPHFGGVNPVHVNNSYHYKDEAIDVSGDVDTMAKFAHRVAEYSRTGKL